jgi:Ni/Co efflux regulator RcnB
MKTSQWFFAGLIGLALATSTPAFAQGNGNGHGKGHAKHEDADRDDRDRDHDRDSYRYYNHEQIIRGWYAERGGNLPPGLAKKDRLPPGLEKQLVRNGTLPPGLQKRYYAVPVELERRLPPPPSDCVHVFISGHLVLLNKHTNLIVDIFAL